MFLVHLSGVKMHFLFQLWTVQRYSIPYCENWRLQIDTWPMHLKICTLWSWQSMRSKVSCRTINGDLSCDPRHLPLSWLCDVRRCPSSDVISELRQRVAVDTLMTSHYSGDVMWIRMEVGVVGRIDAIRLKNASKSIFLTILKMLNWKTPGPGYIMLRLKGKHRPDSVRQPRTLESKNAPVRSYYIDTYIHVKCDLSSCPLHWFHDNKATCITIGFQIPDPHRDRDDKTTRINCIHLEKEWKKKIRGQVSKSLSMKALKLWD
jgi:hypothetical protein